MYNRKKLIIAVVTAIIVLIITLILVLKLISINKNNETEVISDEIENNETEENVIENVIDDSNEENEIIDNNEQTSESKPYIPNTPIADPAQEVDKEVIKKQESNEEKAISIAKKDWGEDNKVYFSFEGINNGKYTVSVRSNDTTRTLRYYYINIDNGSFNIE